MVLYAYRHIHSIAIEWEHTTSDEDIVYAAVRSHHLRRPVVKISPTAEHINWNALDIIAMLSLARSRKVLHC
jgi:hypothetical protein